MVRAFVSVCALASASFSALVSALANRWGKILFYLKRAKVRGRAAWGSGAGMREVQKQFSAKKVQIRIRCG